MRAPRSAPISAATCTGIRSSAAGTARATARSSTSTARCSTAPRSIRWPRWRSRRSRAARRSENVTLRASISRHQVDDRQIVLIVRQCRRVLLEPRDLGRIRGAHRQLLGAVPNRNAGRLHRAQIVAQPAFAQQALRFAAVLRGKRQYGPPTAAAMCRFDPCGPSRSALSSSIPDRHGAHNRERISRKNTRRGRVATRQRRRSARPAACHEEASLLGRSGGRAVRPGVLILLLGAGAHAGRGLLHRAAGLSAGARGVRGLRLRRRGARIALARGVAPLGGAAVAAAAADPARPRG